MMIDHPAMMWSCSMVSMTMMMVTLLMSIHVSEDKCYSYGNLHAVLVVRIRVYGRI